MSDVISTCLVLIPALPLAGAVLVALLGAKVLRKQSHWPIIAAIVGSFVCSAILVWELYDRQQSVAGNAAHEVAVGFEQIVPLWTWADVGEAYNLRPSAPSEQASGAIDAGPRNFRIEVVLRADALTAMMLAMVTFISSLVAVYSVGYMHGDRGYWRFFAYIGLFVFSMTMLVSASNFVLMFVFWEAVGVCSYLVIGFWYEKPIAAAAGMKAFIVNRIGDFGFLLALFLIWTTYGTLNFHDTLSDGTSDPAKVAKVAAGEKSAASAASATNVASAESVASPSDAQPKLVRGVLGQSRLVTNDYVAGGVATAICLLLMLGACGKSAQFPLHVWLPDAMEGPTPVSALIHAATMVTAGVYMIARCTPLFTASPTAQLVVACIGGFTALLAGLIALTQFDLKRVLAYSTVSQLGYMFLAVGVGTFSGVTAGMFHLFTHAFFKALLFLAAGSVMHAMGNVIDMREFGGLRKLLPQTHWTFLCGCLALAGIVPFSGFWSKDAIIGAVHDKIHRLDHEIEHRTGEHPAAHTSHVAGASAATHAGAAGATASTAMAASTIEPPLASLSGAELVRFRTIYWLLYWSALFTAFLTAFYTFRALCMTFYGEEKIPHQAGHHAHESPGVMVAPLVVLAICAVGVGMVFTHDILAAFLGSTPSLAAGPIVLTGVHPEFHLSVAGISTVVAVAGIVLAMYLYLGHRDEVTVLQQAFDLQWARKLTDLEWIPRLEQVWWIGGVTRPLRQIGFGWLVSLVGYLLGIVALVLAIPLMLARFFTPYKLSYGKFYLDELYNWVVVRPLEILAAVLSWFDHWIVDGLVNLIGRIPPAAGSLMRSLQMGLVQFYALAMVLGALILIVAKVLWAAG